MITTITLSPCLDKTVNCECFDIDSMNRVEMISLDVGGKGINVSRALNRFGIKTKALGFNFENGELIEKTLIDENIENSFISCEGSLRVNLKLFDKSRKNTIEINEKSPRVSKQKLDEFISIYVNAVIDSDIVILTGSLPTGISDDIYLKLSLLAKEINPAVKIILDAQGEVLLKGLEAKPYMIKPNKFELETTFKRKLESNDDVISLCREIIERFGVEIVLASLGKDGAMLVTKDEAIFKSALKVDVKSTQGAGDSMVAGACLAISKGLDNESVIKYAVASAAGAISEIGTSFCSLEKLNELLKG